MPQSTVLRCNARAFRSALETRPKIANIAMKKIPSAIITSTSVKALRGDDERRRPSSRQQAARSLAPLSRCIHCTTLSTLVRPVVTSSDTFLHSFLLERKINVISSLVPFG